MSTNDSTMEAALLEIAKDLLQASDDLAATDPSASAKLAHEAYEIGRDLGIVRNHVDDTTELASVFRASSFDGESQTQEQANPRGGDNVSTRSSRASSYHRSQADDETDAGLSRILDRQRAMLPKPVELAPVRKPSRGSRSLTFEATSPKRSSWFGWMRPREWRHAG